MLTPTCAKKMKARMYRGGERNAPVTTACLLSIRSLGVKPLTIKELPGIQYWYTLNFLYYFVDTPNARTRTSPYLLCRFKA